MGELVASVSVVAGGGSNEEGTRGSWVKGVGDCQDQGVALETRPASARLTAHARA